MTIKIAATILAAALALGAPERACAAVAAAVATRVRPGVNPAAAAGRAGALRLTLPAPGRMSLAPAPGAAPRLAPSAALLPSKTPAEPALPAAALPSSFIGGQPQAAAAAEPKAGVPARVTRRPSAPRRDSIRATLRKTAALAKESLEDASSRGAEFSAGAAGKAFDGGRGESPRRVLLVGSYPARPYLLERAVAAADEFGVELVLLDSPAHREHNAGKVPAANLIEADIFRHDEQSTRAIAEQVAAYAAGKAIDAVFVSLNPFAELAGVLADRLGARGNPAAAVRAAHDKARAREILNQDPELATPYRLVRSAAEAAQAARELPASRFVLKPVTGAGSQLVEVGIDSPEKAAAAYEKIRAGQAAFAQREDAGFFTLDGDRGVMIEAMLEGPEVDVELVIAGGDIRWSLVSDNPPMDGAVEKADTYPSQMPAAMQAEFVRRAGKAVKLLGLKDGNYHVEMMWTAGGPKVLEVNARMGGAYGWQSMRDLLGVDLVREGLAAVLGLALTAPNAKAARVLEVRNINPKLSGRIVAIEGAEALARMPGFVRYEPFKRLGDRVRGPEADADDPIGFVSFFGKDYAEAMDRQLAALGSIRIVIETDSGERVEQSAAWGHERVDPLALVPKAAPKGAPSSQATAVLLSPERAPELPRSYYWYLGGIALEAIGMEAIAVLLPVYAYFTSGLGFMVLSMAVYLAVQLPGNWVGARLVGKLDSRRVYQLAVLAVGAAFMAIPAAVIAWGTVSPALVLAFTAIEGVAYAFMRGVAEHEIQPRIVGQESRALLQRAGSLFFLVVEPAAVATGWIVGGALAALGLSDPAGMQLAGAVSLHGLAAGAAAILLASFYPFTRITYKQDGVKQGTGGTEDRLPMAEYLPFVFFRALHLGVYTLFAPVFALSLFANMAAGGWIVGAYSFGSMIYAGLDTFFPKAVEKLSRRQWTLLGLGTGAAFLWATLAAQWLPLTIGLAFPLGFAATAAFTQWPAVYKQRLKLERQPGVFQALSNASVAAALLPFGLIYGLLFLGSGASMALLLGLVFAGVTAAALWVALTAK